MNDERDPLTILGQVRKLVQQRVGEDDFMLLDWEWIEKKHGWRVVLGIREDEKP